MSTEPADTSGTANLTPLLEVAAASAEQTRAALESTEQIQEAAAALADRMENS